MAAPGARGPAPGPARFGLGFRREQAQPQAQLAPAVAPALRAVPRVVAARPGFAPHAGQGAGLVAAHPSGSGVAQLGVPVAPNGQRLFSLGGGRQGPPAAPQAPRPAAPALRAAAGAVSPAGALDRAADDAVARALGARAAAPRAADGAAAGASGGRGAEGGSAGSRSGAPREAASATAGGLVQTKPNDPWAWSTGHAAYYAQVKDKASDKKRRGASRSRSRRGDARGDAAPAGPPRGSRSRSRGGEAERRRDRSRSRGRRRRDRSEKRQRDVEVEGPSDRGLFRVNCVFGVGLSIGRTMTATGPWRTSREGAEADGERLRAAYYQGGPSTLTAVKNALYADEKSGGSAAPPAVAPVPMEALQGGHVWEIEQQKEGKEFRAACKFAKTVHYDARNKRMLNVIGPWRLSQEQAERDAVCICDGFDKGGASEASKVKNELHRGAFSRKPPDAPQAVRRAEPAAVPAPAPAAAEPAAAPPAPVAVKVEDASGAPSSNADDSVEVCQGGFKAVCKFATQRDTSWGSQNPTGEMAVAGPARATAAEAWADADAMRRAHTAGGLPEVHKLKNDMYRERFKNQPDAATERAALALLAEADSERHGAAKSEVVADSRGKGFRAECNLPADSDSKRHFQKNVVVHVAGPWRTSRTEAESDEAQLLAAYRSGGVEAASAARNELRRQVSTAGGSAIAAASIVEKLSGDDMAGMYGKGFRLAKLMGYSAGSGLGRQEQGIDKPVSIDGARASTPHASSRLGLGSGAGEAYRVDDSDEEGAKGAPAGAPAAIAFRQAGTLEPEAARAAPELRPPSPLPGGSPPRGGSPAAWRPAGAAAALDPLASEPPCQACSEGSAAVADAMQQLVQALAAAGAVMPAGTTEKLPPDHAGRRSDML